MEDSSAVPPVEPNQPESAALSLLAARVAELEQQVAALTAVLRPVAPPPERFRQSVPRDRPAPPPIVDLPVIPPPPSPPPTAFAPKKSLEDRLGAQVFNLIGIVALIFGSAWALKLAIEHGLVGPSARVIIGLAAGTGLVLWSELFRRKGLSVFSYSLKAVGTGVLYLSLWAAFQLYHLLPAPVALLLMMLVTAWNAFMAFTQDAELLAAYALVGGLLTPVLLSSGGDHETFLFAYLAVIDLAVVTLLRSKPWPRLLAPAFLATFAYFIGYFSEFFKSSLDWTSQSTETALFALIFFAIFALVSTRFWNHEPATETGILIPVLIPLANAAFVSLALYSVFEDSGLHTSLAWLMVALAALFLGLMRLQKTTLASAMHLASAVVFLTIAIPLMASGHSLTIAWLVEGLVLFWASTRFKGEPQTPSKVLAILSAGGYALGLVSVVFHWTWTWSDSTQPPFFNANLGSALVAIAVLAGAAWLSLPHPEATNPIENPAVLVASSIAIVAVTLLLTLREIASNFTGATNHPAFANSDFATALVALALLAATSWAASRIAKLHPQYPEPLRIIAAATLILFNLVAILTVEREIGALWTRAEADLQRSLAISAFLMAYAGVLLALGFWRRNAFVRWQALLLILFTIAKVFLYDISGLSAGYRVASFLALGVLLLTVSFAYQKDWFSLKIPLSNEPDGERP